LQKVLDAARRFWRGPEYVGSCLKAQEDARRFWRGPKYARSCLKAQEEARSLGNILELYGVFYFVLR
jgi:hypothetical protein